MAFALVGYPVVASNYYRHDPFDQPPHPLLAQILKIVATSQHHAQVATFMANMTADNQVNYFNHSFINGAIDKDIMEAAENQAVKIMKEAVENTIKTSKALFTTSPSSPPLAPYMSFGYLDQEQQNMNGYNNDDVDHLPDNHIITDPTQIEKYGYIPYLNYYYYHNDIDQQDNHDMMGVDEEDCLSDADKAVQHQVDELETVCSSSSSYQLQRHHPVIQVEGEEAGENFIENVPENIQYYHDENNNNTNRSLFSGINRERRGHYYYDLFSDMPNTRHANEVAQEERGRIWDPYYALYDGSIPEQYSNQGSNRYSRVSSQSGKDSILTFHDEFPELPKRETQAQQSTLPPSITTSIISQNKLQKPSIDYASVVKRNIITKDQQSLQKTKVPNKYDTPCTFYKNPTTDQIHPVHSFHSDASSLSSSSCQQNKNLCYETIMHNNNNENNSTHSSPIKETIDNNKNNNLCQHDEHQKQYMQHMINNNNGSAPGVLCNDNDDDSAKHQQMIKNQTITPHANNAAPTTITKPKQVNNTNSSTIHVLNYAAIVKRNADVTKRKAISSPQCAPSKKIQKQNNDLSSITDTTTIGLAIHPTTINNDSTNNNNNSTKILVEASDEIRNFQQERILATGSTLKKTPEAAPQLIPSPQVSGANNGVVPDDSGIHVTQAEQEDQDDSDSSKPATNAIVTPYAEIARRNAAKKHPSFLDGGTSMRLRSTIFSKYDRLEQQLVRPAVIPWVETGDPLTHLYQKERKQAKEFGVQMDRYFQLSQKYYHQKDWDNAKYYSDKGQYFRQRMHELHTRASQRIFEQRNQQDALFIDLHGMHVEEAKASIISWFHELKDYRGIVYIVTGTGHHSRRRSTSSSIHSTMTTSPSLTNSTKKEKKLRPAIRNFLNNLYRCEETSVHGDDKGGVFAVYLCPHVYIPHYSSSACVYCKFKNDKLNNNIMNDDDDEIVQ